LHLVADLQPHRSKDVTFFAIRVMEQGDERRAVGVVLDGGHFRRHIELVTPEVDDAIPPLVTAAAVA